MGRRRPSMHQLPPQLSRVPHVFGPQSQMSLLRCASLLLLGRCHVHQASASAVAGTLGWPAPLCGPARDLSLTSQVASVCVEALVEPAASNKVVEIVARENAPLRTYQDLFSSVSV